MSNSEPVLFVGGPRNGERLALPYGLRGVCFDGGKVGGQVGAVVRYRVERLVGESCAFRVCVFEGISLDEALVLLLAGYVAAGAGQGETG